MRAATLLVSIALLSVGACATGEDLKQAGKGEPSSSAGHDGGPVSAGGRDGGVSVSNGGTPASNGGATESGSGGSDVGGNPGLDASSVVDASVPVDASEPPNDAG